MSAAAPAHKVVWGGLRQWLSHLSGWGYRSSSYERTQGGIVRCLCALTPSQQQPTPNTSLAHAPAGLEALHLTLPRNRSRWQKRCSVFNTPRYNCTSKYVSKQAYLLTYLLLTYR